MFYVLYKRYLLFKTRERKKRTFIGLMFIKQHTWNPPLFLIPTILRKKEKKFFKSGKGFRFS